jgi:hypothetical protein
MPERENFYILLGLDPDVTDAAVIKAHIEDGKRRWREDQSKGIAARRKAKFNLDQLPDIERVMNDPAARREEAEDARRRLHAQRQARVPALDSAIDVMRAGGTTCTRERFAPLLKEFGQSFSETEIVERMRAAGVAFDESTKKPAATAEKPKLDPVRMAGLRPKLELLKVKNLYEFLELKPVSSARALYDRADEILKEILRIGLTDVESSARKDLCGECIALFKSDDDKQKYDNALVTEPMEGLRPSIEMAGATDLFLSVEEQDVLVKQARELGVTADAARGWIEEYARKRKWGVQPAASLPAEALRQCGYCSTLEKDARAQNCRRCGEPLVVACPRCDTKMPTTHAACTSCGYRVGDAPLVKALLREGERLALGSEFGPSLAALDRALLYWPGWEPALAARKNAEARRAARDKAMSDIDALVRARELVAARAAIERLRQTHGATGADALEGRIASGLARAEAIEQEAEQLRGAGRTEEAMARFEQAVEECADLPRARAALHASPPPPPTALRADALRDGFRLQWQAAAGRSRLRYRVVRKARERPRHRDDGVVLGDVGDRELHDLDAPVGTPLYYAVFAVRGDVCSTESAAAGPLLLLADVGDLQAVAGDNEITVRWQRPPGCARVEVWRNAGAAPVRRGEGVQLPAGETGIQDAGVRNGEHYGYRVVTVYDDPGRRGSELFSAGVALAVTPGAPPPAVLDLRTERSGSRLTLAWTPPAGAAVQIRRAAHPPDVPAGSVVPLSALDRFGTLVDAQGRGRAEWTVDVQGQLVFVPITVGTANAVVGQPVVIVTIDDVTNVRTKINGRDILLSWDWPPGADDVAVCYRNDQYPVAPDETGATCARATRAAYRRNDGFEIRAAQPARHFFTLFVRASAGAIYSAGARVFESMGQGTIVRYRAGVKKSGIFGRSVDAAWVELQCDEPLASLPAVIVLGKDGRQPLSPGDGALLAEEPDLHFADGRARIEIPKERATRSTYVKVFFKDGRHAREIRLQPASSELLRLG